MERKRGGGVNLYRRASAGAVRACDLRPAPVHELCSPCVPRKYLWKRTTRRPSPSVPIKLLYPNPLLLPCCSRLVSEVPRHSREIYPHRADAVCRRLSSTWPLHALPSRDRCGLRQKSGGSDVLDRPAAQRRAPAGEHAVYPIYPADARNQLNTPAKKHAITTTTDPKRSIILLVISLHYGTASVSGPGAGSSSDNPS